MCGIAGLLTLERPVDAELVAGVLRMMNAQLHRGPDDRGILLPDQALRDSQIQGLLASFGQSQILTYPGSVKPPAVILGARRLSIIDLSPRGRMPMGNADRSVWLTYNGEIYNYRELRDELRSKGYAFHSDTDTETILHGYEEWGHDVVRHLRGMFAFAVLDIRQSDKPKLFLSKDRFGMKPLYWGRRSCLFQFASEVRALVAGGLLPNEPEPRGLNGFLVYGSVPTPYTTVRDIFSLPAAHTLTIDELTYSYPRPLRYWSLPVAGSITMSLDDAARETRRLLEQSIESHLISDVPLGVFLSGGVDSSAITAIAAKYLPRQLTTLCVSFDEKPFSEGDHAKQVASRFGSNHIDVRLRGEEFAEEIPRILETMDQPTVDGVNTYFIAKAARKAGLTVVLSGLGGDELFWGYPGIHSAPRIFKWAGVPGARPGAVLVSAIARLFDHQRWEKLDFIRQAMPTGAYLAVRGLFPPRHAAKLLGSGVLPLIGPERKISSFTAADYAEMDVLFYLQNQLLRDTDVFGMAHSLEIRVPFLDHVLAEFIFALPDSLKLSTPINKSLLVSALGSDLGPETATRAKMGFTFPFELWMRKFKGDISRYTDHAWPVEVSQAGAVEKAFDKGRIHWSRPWTLTVLNGLAKRGGLPDWPKERGPTRFLFLLPELYASKGGIQAYNQNILRAAQEAFPRTEIRVISVNDSAVPPESPLLGRVHFRGCGPRSSGLFKMRVFFSSVREALFHRPDLVVCGHINLLPLALTVSLLTGSRIALSAHGIETWSPKPVSRWAVRRARRIFSVSHYTANKMVEWGVDRGRIQILPDTVDGEVFRPTLRCKPGNGRSLLTVCRLDRSEGSKGVEQVLRTLKDVRSRYPDVRYVIAGTGNDLPRLKALAESIGVADCVEFRGYVPDESLPALYGESDLFAMPSQKEGFGIVFLEALACGLPVLAGDRDGSVDAVLNGSIGLLVDPEDDSQIKKGICRLLDGEVDEKLKDPKYLRSEVLAHYGFDQFRLTVRDVFLDATRRRQS